MYDGVFGICVPEMVMVANANHLEDVNLIEVKLFMSSNQGYKWKLAAEKIETILLNNRKTNNIVNIRTGSHQELAMLCE